MLPRLPGLSKANGDASPPFEFAAAVTGPPLLSSLWLSVEVRGSLPMRYLLWLRSTPKNNPSVQCGGPPSAARTRTDADPICGPRNHIAQPDLRLVRDESRQTNPIGLALTRLLGFACRGFLSGHVTGSRAASASFDRRTPRRAWAAQWQLG